MTSNQKENLQQIDIKSGLYRGKNLGKEARRTMTHAALCKWLPRFGYLILFAVLVELLRLPASLLALSGIPDLTSLASQLLKNK